MVLYMGSFMLNTVLEQAFFVHKACSVDLKLSASICANISAEENKEYYKRVQVSFEISIWYGTLLQGPLKYFTALYTVPQILESLTEKVRYIHRIILRFKSLSF